MNPYQQAVHDFHVAMNQPHPDHATLEDYPFELRAKLILEEALEFVQASGLYVYAGDGNNTLVELNSKVPECKIDFAPGKQPPDWPEMVDALCDLLYVVFGAAVSMGVDLDPFFDAVHKANMLKSTGPVREDGKRLKPPGWTPPDIAGLLEALRAKENAR